ncbi:hypothetical protein NT6N_01800 [Oceaniferula spumae]|uniref:Uncharacterized protein n=1 Tax=Oceaniferula spumae TaxID=2979115 RepID=A0AAT9FGN1_9BACT
MHRIVGQGQYSFILIIINFASIPAKGLMPDIVLFIRP